MEYFKIFNIIICKKIISIWKICFVNSNRRDLSKLRAPDSRQIWLPLNPLLKREKEKEGRASQSLAVFWSKVTRLIETSLARVSFLDFEREHANGICLLFFSFILFFFLSFIFLSLFFFFPPISTKLRNN